MKMLTPFLEVPPKLQLALSAQIQIVLSLAFTLLIHFVKNSLMVSALPSGNDLSSSTLTYTPFEGSKYLMSTGNILVSLWFDASIITEMKSAFYMLD
jgi:hypothetical protein